MSVKNATEYINFSTINKLFPLSVNRKQAASGLLSEGNVVDIYKNN